MAVCSDLAAEPDETFTVTLSNPVNASFLSGASVAGTATIR